MRRFERYRVADDDEVQAAYFNGVHEDVDLRLHAVEEKAVGWDEQVERFEDVALGRIDAALLPVLQEALVIRERIETAAHLGTIFTAQSSSQVTVGTGIRTFLIREEDHQRFAPAGFLVMSSEIAPQNWMAGRLNDYDAASRELSVLVTATGGTGAHSDWFITATTDPVLASSILAAAQSAAASVTAAAQSAQQAATSQQAAASQAASAANAANLAAASRTQANASAIAAAGSADTASTAATSAQAMLAGLGAKYAGASATAPSSDALGNALTPGVLWFDTGANLMKVYTGAVWIVAASSVFRSSSIETFAASEGQTVFTIGGGYDVGRVTVYRNGLRLIAGTGFTAVNGTTVTLGTPAAAGDAIEVEKSIFILSDVWSKAEADARFLMPTSPLDGGAY
jgi:hypothetical protein